MQRGMSHAILLCASALAASCGSGSSGPTPSTTPPSIPGNLAATAASASQINVAWAASTSSVGITAYLLERCQGAGCASFAQIAAPSGTAFNDTAIAGIM